MCALKKIGSAMEQGRDKESVTLEAARKIPSLNGQHLTGPLQFTHAQVSYMPSHAFGRLISPHHPAWYMVKAINKTHKHLLSHETEQ